MLGRLAQGALTQSRDETEPSSGEEFSSDESGRAPSDEGTPRLAVRIERETARLNRQLSAGDKAAREPRTGGILKTSPSLGGARRRDAAGGGGAAAGVTFSVKQVSDPSLGQAARPLDVPAGRASTQQAQPHTQTPQTWHLSPAVSPTNMMISPLTDCLSSEEVPHVDSAEAVAPAVGGNKTQQQPHSKPKGLRDGVNAQRRASLDCWGQERRPVGGGGDVSGTAGSFVSNDSGQSGGGIPLREARAPTPLQLQLQVQQANGGGGNPIASCRGIGGYGVKKLTLGDVERRQVQQYRAAAGPHGDANPSGEGAVVPVSEGVEAGYEAAERTRLQRLMSLMGRVKAKEDGGDGEHIVKGFKLLLQLQEDKARGERKRGKERGAATAAAAVPARCERELGRVVAPFAAWNDSFANSEGHRRAKAQEKRRNICEAVTAPASEGSSDEASTSSASPLPQARHPHAMRSPQETRSRAQFATDSPPRPPFMDRPGGDGVGPPHHGSAGDSSASGGDRRPERDRRRRGKPQRSHVHRTAALRSPRSPTRHRRTRADRLTHEAELRVCDRVVRELAYEHMLSRQGYPPQQPADGAAPAGGQHMQYIHTEVNQQFGHLKAQHESLIHQFIGVVKAERSAQEDLRKRQVEEHASQMSSLRAVAEEAAAAKVAHQARVRDMESELSEHKFHAEGQLRQLRQEALEAQRVLDAAREEQRRLREEQVKLVQQAEASQAALQQKALQFRQEQHTLQQQYHHPPAPAMQAPHPAVATAHPPALAAHRSPSPTVDRKDKKDKKGFFAKLRGKDKDKDKKDKNAASLRETVPEPAPAQAVPMAPPAGQNVPIGVMMQRPTSAAPAPSAGDDRGMSSSSPEPVQPRAHVDDLSDFTSATPSPPQGGGRRAKGAASPSMSRSGSESEETPVERAPPPPPPKSKKELEAERKAEKKRREKEAKEAKEREKQAKKAKAKNADDRGAPPSPKKGDKKDKKEKKDKKKKEKKEKEKEKEKKGGILAMLGRIGGPKKPVQRTAHSLDGIYVMSLTEGTHLSIVHTLTARLKGKVGQGDDWCYKFTGLDATDISSVEKRDILKALCEPGAPQPDAARLNEKHAATLLELCRFYGGTGLLTPGATEAILKKKVKRDGLKKHLDTERLAAFNMVLDHLHDAFAGVPVGTRERVMKSYAEAMCWVADQEKQKKIALWLLAAGAEKVNHVPVEIPTAKPPAPADAAPSSFQAPQESSSSSSSDDDDDDGTASSASSPPPAQPTAHTTAQNVGRRNYNDSDDDSSGDADAAPSRFVPTGMEGYQLKQRGGGQHMVSA